MTVSKDLISTGLLALFVVLIFLNLIYFHWLSHASLSEPVMLASEFLPLTALLLRFKIDLSGRGDYETFMKGLFSRGFSA